MEHVSKVHTLYDVGRKNETQSQVVKINVIIRRFIDYGFIYDLSTHLVNNLFSARILDVRWTSESDV